MRGIVISRSHQKTFSRVAVAYGPSGTRIATFEMTMVPVMISCSIKNSLISCISEGRYYLRWFQITLRYILMMGQYWMDAGAPNRVNSINSISLLTGSFYFFLIFSNIHWHHSVSVQFCFRKKVIWIPRSEERCHFMRGRELRNGRCQSVHPTECKSGTIYLHSPHHHHRIYFFIFVTHSPPDGWRKISPPCLMLFLQSFDYHLTHGVAGRLLNT